MKPALGRICFGLAVVTLVSGFFVMCACPGWFGVGAAFAALSVRCCTPGLKFYAWLVLLASLAMTVLHLISLIKDR